MAPVVRDRVARDRTARLPCRRRGTRLAAAVVAFATILAGLAITVSTGAAQGTSCPTPDRSGDSRATPDLPDFMKFDHLPPYLDFLTSVRNDDYLQAQAALCRIINATRTAPGRRMIARDLDQDAFEAFIEFREVLTRAERLVAVLAETRDVPAASRGFLRNAAIEIGSACNACHQKTGGPGGVVPPNPRIRAILGD